MLMVETINLDISKTGYEFNKMIDIMVEVIYNSFCNYYTLNITYEELLRAFYDFGGCDLIEDSLIDINLFVLKAYNDLSVILFNNAVDIIDLDIEFIYDVKARFKPNHKEIEILIIYH